MLLIFMNIFTALFFIAPGTLVIILIYLMLYQHNTVITDINREQQQLEAMKFDCEFHQAWHQQPCSEAQQQAIYMQAEKIKSLQEKRQDLDKNIADTAVIVQQATQTTEQENHEPSFKATK